MQRYSLKYGMDFKLREDPEGDWVRFADTLNERVDAALVRNLLAEVERLRADAARWDLVRRRLSNWQELCALIVTPERGCSTTSANLDAAVDRELAEEAR